MKIKLRYVSLILLLFSFKGAIGIYAQSKEIVCLNLSNPDGQYNRGDTIRVWGCINGIPSELLEMTVLLDGKKDSTTPVALTVDRSTIYEGVFDEAKSVIVRIVGKDSKERYAEVGAVVAPDDFRPFLDEPKDFTKYWKKQLRNLRKCKAVATLTGQDLEISMPEGPSVHGILAKPEVIGNKGVPAVLYLHGAGVNKPGNRAQLSHIDKYVKAGAIALDINAHGFPNNMPQEYYDSLAAGPLKNYRARPLTTRDEYYFRLMILRAVRALDYLCSLPEWDGKNLVVVGASQGGYQAICAAALHKKVSLLVTTVPAHTALGASKYGKAETWPWNYSDSSILPYFDGANFWRHVKCQVIAEAGLIDTVCHPYCVWAGYNVCPSKDKTIYFFSYRPHGEKDIPAARYEEYRGKIKAKKEARVFKMLQTLCVFGEIRHDRKDDLCWENEFSGYRAFGPAVQAHGEKSYGYDIFTKSVPYPVLHERYNKNITKGEGHQSFHLDHGDGMDSYAVGPTLGCGTAALVDSSGIVYPWCWKDAEILCNGPKRFQVRLTYSPVLVNGRNVIEQRLITLDSGSRLNRVDITFDGLDEPTPIVIGIVVHAENPDGWYADDYVLSVADLGDRNIGQNGEIYSSVVLPEGFAHYGFESFGEQKGSAIGHVLGYGTYYPGKTFTYWFGSGWSKAGIASLEEWINLTHPHTHHSDNSRIQSSRQSGERRGNDK